MTDAEVLELEAARSKLKRLRLRRNVLEERVLWATSRLELARAVAKIDPVAVRRELAALGVEIQRARSRVCEFLRRAQIEAGPDRAA